MLVKQVDNVLSLLEFFADRQKPATLAQVAKQFGWPRSSTFNILTTLAERGFLYEARARGGYYPTPRWLELAQSISDAEPLSDRIVRILHSLAKDTGETIWVTAPSGQHGIFMMVVESDQPVRYAARTGNRVPLHATASGQALLSQMTEAEVDRLLRKVTYERYNQNTPMDREEVLTQIAEGRKRGWFRSASNYSSDLGGVSVPLIDEARLFSITVAGPLYRCEPHMPEHAHQIYAAIAREYGPTHSRDSLIGINVIG